MTYAHSWGNNMGLQSSTYQAIPLIYTVSVDYSPTYSNGIIKSIIDNFLYAPAAGKIIIRITTNTPGILSLVGGDTYSNVTYTVTLNNGRPLIPGLYYEFEILTTDLDQYFDLQFSTSATFTVQVIFIPV